MIAAISTLLLVFGGLAIATGWRSGGFKLILAGVLLTVAALFAPHIKVPISVLILGPLCLGFFTIGFFKRRKR